MTRVVGLLVAATLAAVSVPVGGGDAWAQAETRTQAQKREAERKAQRAFIAGKYEEAIDLLAGLYSEFHEPVYLRNIGRSYQRLKQPDRAIASFEEYLLKAKDVTPAERDEVRGFIREMEDLRRAQAPAPAPAPAPTPRPAQPPTPAPAAAPAPAPPPAPAPQPAPAATVDVTTPAPPPSPPSGRWSAGRIGGLAAMAAAVGLAAGGVYMMADAWSQYDKGKKDCPQAVLGCNDIADKVSSKTTLSKILLVSGAVVGAGGATLFLLTPTHENGGGVAMALARRF